MKVGDKENKRHGKNDSEKRRGTTPPNPPGGAAWRARDLLHVELVSTPRTVWMYRLALPSFFRGRQVVSTTRSVLGYPSSRTLSRIRDLVKTWLGLPASRARMSNSVLVSAIFRPSAKTSYALD